MLAQQNLGPSAEGARGNGPEGGNLFPDPKLSSGGGPGALWSLKNI